MRRLLLLVVAVCALACSSAHWLLPSPQSCSAPPPGAPTQGLHAAAVEVDITPPIGLSIYGHGLEGRIARGLMTHLFCRGMVLRTAQQPLAWVTCELQSISLPLQRRVAEIVQMNVRDLGADRLVLTATHTHGGPGHFIEGRAYETPEGGSRLPGYDQRVVDFLASRIADGIVAAHRRLEPAHLRSGVVPCVLGISRNRAMPAYLLDLGRVEPCSAADGMPEASDPAHAAVNRDLTIVRVDGAKKPLGAIVVYAVHNTAMPNTNDLYHGDLASFAATSCSALVKNGPIVCVIANGAEGDVSPDWAYQGELEARRIGERLSAVVVDAFDRLSPDAPDAVAEDPPIVESRYAEIDLPGAQAEFVRDSLCPYPIIGAPAGGGAPDGPTRLRIFEQVNPGMIHPSPPPGACAKPRIDLLGISPSNVSDYKAGWGFPPRVPMTWLRIGSQAFIAVPGEPTTVAGCRLAQRAHDALRGRLGPSTEPCRRQEPVAGIERTTLLALAGAYGSYFATREEFQAQQYEGASTIYGPATIDVLGDRIARLVGTAPGHADCDDRHERAPYPYTSGPEPAFTKGHGDNPDLREPDAYGVVGAIHISPPLVSRWPDGASRACVKGSPADLDALCSDLPKHPVGKVRFECTATAPVIYGDWSDEDATKPLCGEATATLLFGTCNETDGWRVARVQGGGATWQSGCPTIGSGAGWLAIDDRNGWVALAWTEPTSGWPDGHWTARYRFGAYAPAGETCYRFALRRPDGTVRVTPEVKVDCGLSMPPACPERSP